MGLDTCYICRRPNEWLRPAPPAREFWGCRVCDLPAANKEAS